MKKFSTIARSLAASAILAAFASVAAPAAASSTSCAFLANAPDKHLVVQGDTLWGISGKFLQNPWCWPQVWGMNREEIRNPHWIYPGQIVYFDRAAGRLRLGTPTGSGSGAAADVRLSPQVRMEGLGQNAVPAIPANMIEPFLSQPLIIEEDELQGTPRIMAVQEGRVNVGKDDRTCERGDLKGGTSFQVFRPGSALKDPVTRAVIGYEATYLGTIKLQRAARTEDEAHTFTVVNIKEEMSIGDRLLPVPPTPILNYVPHPPQQQIEARVVSVYGGVTNAGQNQVVTVNRGKNDGLDLGTVLELYHAGQIVPDRTDGKRPVKLPDEQYGTLFVFRVFNNISYGLIMQVTEPVNVGDVAQSPE